MNIQWFPGHMKKAFRGLEESLKMINLVICVLDARAPFSCINPSLEKILQNKTIVYAINKCDLANPVDTTKWENYFKSKGNPVVRIDATKSSARKIVEPVIMSELKKRDEKKNRVIKTKFRVAIVGVPNTGKSTLLNTLAGSYLAKTGNKAGVTRNSNWIKVNDSIELMDNAGTLYPKMEDSETSENLAILGSINDAVIDPNELALVTLGRLLKIAPNALVERYNLETILEDPQELIEVIGKKRGYVLRGGVVDLERTAREVVDDFRKGRLGRITLETVEGRIK